MSVPSYGTAERSWLQGVLNTPIGGVLNTPIGGVINSPMYGSVMMNEPMISSGAAVAGARTFSGADILKLTSA